MNLPFTPTQFFAVFAAYNQAVWPAQLVLVAVALAIVAGVAVAPARAGRWVSWGLALLWVWMALIYHLGFFWAVNPVAPLFAALSLAAAGAFVWLGVVRQHLRFEPEWDARKSVGLLTIVFALGVYPAWGILAGERYPALPSFGLPCPTTIFSFGLLLMVARPMPRWVLAAPMLWAAIGSVAAFSLNVPQDSALIVMLVMGFYMLAFNQLPARKRSKKNSI
jgi:Family of unknown function (DUF6064)